MGHEMRITFVGATEFSKHCLDIVKRYVDDVQVLTREGGHGDWADLNGINIEDINDEEKRIRAFSPDYIFVFGWSQIIGKHILDIAPVLGTHPTLLPRGRGRHALGHVLNRKLPFSGLTFFWIDEGVDTGDIFFQKHYKVSSQDDLRSLYEKMKGAVSELLPTIIQLLQHGDEIRTPQDDDKATYWEKLPEDEQIDYSRYFGSP